MLILRSFKKIGDTCPSPFGIKAEALLKIGNLDYRYENAMPMKTPNGKLPVLVDGERVIADSSHIQRHLETEHAVDFDRHLDARQIATAQAFRRMAEEHLYFVLVWSRWSDQAEQTRRIFFPDMPKLLASFIFPMIRKNVVRSVFAQGLGRHKRDAIYEFGFGDLEAIANRIDGPFFFGRKISSLDASLYGQLQSIRAIAIDTPLRERLLTTAPLMTYCDTVGAALASFEEASAAGL